MIPATLFARPMSLSRSRCTCTSLSRSFATFSTPLSTSFNRPSPPPLPPKEQREFEELIRRQNAPASKPLTGVGLDQPEQDQVELHPDYRAKPKPKFQGDRNPETGEVGGPKNEPLQHGDWSYGGKVTDF
ncbi:Sdh8p [Sporobolomyces koalae]|uniref:Sdh8p n=1 Tax=Sporobolomyces koalae TaxID=500713 RepID=UPI0031731556